MKNRALKPTVITGDSRESTSISASAGVSFVAPYLEHTGASRMSNHVMTDMTRYSSSTNDQTSSSSCAPSSSSRPAERSPEVSLQKEIAELRSRLSTNSEFDNFFGSFSEPTTVLRKKTESSPLRNFSKLTQPSDCSDNEESCPASSNLQFYQLRQITSEEHLHLAMLPHVLFTISPNVIKTFEILEGVDPRDPSAVLSHLLSFCQNEDPAVTY
ncbi:hypothetical protein P9112_002196 [Eukaryota sp. TZLM1-RC]